MELASISGHGMLSTLAIHSSCAEIWQWARVGAPEDEGRASPRNIVVLKQGDDGEVQNLKSSYSAAESFRRSLVRMSARQLVIFIDVLLLVFIECHG
jgi:hypothetical protein